MEDLRGIVAELPGAQEHLLRVDDPAALAAELTSIDAVYTGGLKEYVATGRRLLQETGTGVSDLRPAPLVTAPLAGTAAHASNEETAVEELRHTAFVLVAGGLGERLGYSGIKVKLPVGSATPTTYLEHYFAWIKAVAGPDACVAIMTSSDTHAPTIAMLEEHGSFGLTSVAVVQQQTVPCLSDKDGKIALQPGTSKLLRKPHGHGDVHGLLLANGVLEAWQSRNVRWAVFFQDTNAAMTLTVPQTIATMAKDSVAMAFTCVPRNSGEAVGALASAVCRDGVRRVQNVEYNVFDAAYAEAAAKDPAAAMKPSDYGGSINTLLVAFGPYAAAVTKTAGRVPEFINPKFADDAKTVFKSPTRVESLMQDVVLLLPEDSRVVGVIFDSSLYTPLKNQLTDGVAKAAKGIAAHCGATAEEAVIAQRRGLMEATGVSLPCDQARSVTIQGKLAVNLFPIIVFDARFAALFTGLKQRLPSPSNVKVSARSCLVVHGDVTIEALTLNGTLVINAAPGATVVIRRLTVINRGWQAVPLEEGADADEVAKVRGYTLARTEQCVLNFDQGDHIVNEAGVQSNM